MTKTPKKNKKSSLKPLKDDFIPKKTADEIIDELKKAKNFTRETVEFSSYDQVFVAKVLKGVKARENGEKGLRVDVENMWD